MVPNKLTGTLLVHYSSIVTNLRFQIEQPETNAHLITKRSLSSRQVNLVTSVLPLTPYFYSCNYSVSQVDYLILDECSQCPVISNLKELVWNKLFYFNKDYRIYMNFAHGLNNLGQFQIRVKFKVY